MTKDTPMAKLAAFSRARAISLALASILPLMALWILLGWKETNRFDVASTIFIPATFAIVVMGLWSANRLANRRIKSRATAALHAREVPPAIDEVDDDERIHRKAQYLGALVLADAVAGLIDADSRAALETLLDLPDNLVPMLDSPQGWTILAAHIANDLSAAEPRFAPTVH